MSASITLSAVNSLDFDSASDNPYASPATTEQAPVRKDIDMDDAEQTRRKYLSHEANLRSAGTVYIIGFLILTFSAFSFALTMPAMIKLQRGVGPTEAMWAFLLCALPFCLGVWQLVIGIGLRKLKIWVRIQATLVAMLWMAWIPFGTIISAYFLYLIWSRKAKVVMSEEYREIIKQTPHVKLRTSLFVWIALFALLAIGAASWVMRASL